MFRHTSNSVFLSLLMLFGPALAKAQTSQTDAQAYCTYLSEQAKAQSDLLRTPNALGAFTQPETGLPTQLVVGATLSVSDFKKAGITLDAARKNCDLYKASTSVQQYLQYALPNIERDALRNRLVLVDQATKSLDDLIVKTAKMVDAQNMTRPMLWAVKTNRIKLDADRADTQSKIAAIYVPPLSAQSLKLQVAEKQSSDVNEQKAQAKLTRQSNWDVALAVGAHQQINPLSDGVEPYGQVTVTYNLASRAIDRHLDRAVNAYTNWKSVQEGDAARGMEELGMQIVDSIAAQERRLKSLQDELQQVAKDMELVKEADTTAALDFRNQLTSTQLLLGVEAGDASYRLDRLQEFLRTNY
jgi:hypothetical protein